MFEVVITKNDDTIETWDCISEIQAQCVFFRARMESSTQNVVLNEVIDI